MLQLKNIKICNDKNEANSKHVHANYCTIMRLVQIYIRQSVDIQMKYIMLRVYKKHIGPARKIKEKFVTKIKLQ